MLQDSACLKKPMIVYSFLINAHGVYVYGLSLVCFCRLPTAPPGCQPKPAWPGSAPASPSAPEIPVHPEPSSQSGAAQRTPHAKQEQGFEADF